MKGQEGSTVVKDPICGKEVDTFRARAVGIFGGVTYYFCSAECKSQFKDPRKTPRPEPGQAPVAREPTGKAARAKARPPTPSAPVAVAPEEGPRPSPEADPTPSVLEEVPAAGGSGRRWLIVLVLFAVGGVVALLAWR